MILRVVLYSGFPDYEEKSGRFILAGWTITDRHGSANVFSWNVNKQGWPRDPLDVVEQ